MQSTGAALTSFRFLAIESPEEFLRTQCWAECDPFCYRSPEALNCIKDLLPKEYFFLGTGKHHNGWEGLDEYPLAVAVRDGAIESVKISLDLEPNLDRHLRKRIPKAIQQFIGQQPKTISIY
jgi:hypothetical protein